MNLPSIVQLPDLCLKKIFTHLGLQDLARCRRVCRLFKFYADQAEVHELVVFTHNPIRFAYSNSFGNWYQTDKRIPSNNVISFEAFSTLNPSQFRLNQQLKFLCVDVRQISSNPDLDLDFELLNAFKQLIHLEVTWGFEKTERCRKELNLPNLKVLNFFFIVCRPLVLRTPKLAALLCEEIDKVEFEYPESIKKLESQYLGASAMAKFKNLELFICFSNASTLDPDLLFAWKHLKSWTSIQTGFITVKKNTQRSEALWCTS